MLYWINEPSFRINDQVSLREFVSLLSVSQRETKQRVFIMGQKKDAKKVFEIDYSIDEEPNLKGDYKNVVLLFILYVLQGS